MRAVDTRFVGHVFNEVYEQFLPYARSAFEHTSMKG
jgi:acyl-CoA thioesterase FadM